MQHGVRLAAAALSAKTHVPPERVRGSAFPTEHSRGVTSRQGVQRGGKLRQKGSARSADSPREFGGKLGGGADGWGGERGMLGEEFGSSWAKETD